MLCKKAGNSLFMLVYENMSTETNVDGYIVDCFNNMGHFGGGCDVNGAGWGQERRRGK